MRQDKINEMTLSPKGAPCLTDKKQQQPEEKNTLSVTQICGQAKMQNAALIKDMGVITVAEICTKIFFGMFFARRSRIRVPADSTASTTADAGMLISSKVYPTNEVTVTPAG